MEMGGFDGSGLEMVQLERIVGLVTKGPKNPIHPACRVEWRCVAVG